MIAAKPSTVRQRGTRIRRSIGHGTLLTIALCALIMALPEVARGEWKGYEQINFNVGGRGALLVVPKTPAPGKQTKVDAVVTVDADKVLEKNFLGVGAQFSPYDAYKLSASDFQLVCQRLDHMGLPLTRIMLMAYWYCKGLDDKGEPIYDWDSWLMQLLYKNLDWCEKNNTTVMIGEWGTPPSRTGIKGLRDPLWARVVADCVEHLLDDKGYTCIKYFNMINEPQGSWSSTRGNWDLWRSVVTNLHHEFVERGLDKRIGIAVADAGKEWTFKGLDDDRVRALAGVYEEHWYLMNKSILSGGMEKETRERVAAIREKDPGKAFFVGECGLHDGLDHVRDQQKNVFNFWYGVSMTDLAIQLIRGGGAGLVVWVLDDAMHQKASRHRKREDDPYEWRKIWGFWDIMAASRGNPEHRNLRPWFYAWSMMTRCFPAGCKTIAAAPSGLDGVRVAAAKIADGDKWHLSMAAVNNSDQERTVRLVVPAAAGQPVTLSKFEYVDKDNDNRVDSWPEVVDANGNDIYPTPTDTLTKVDLGAGLVVSLPPKSVLGVTTIKEGQHLTLR